jgi:hypothetical protein
MRMRVGMEVFVVGNWCSGARTVVVMVVVMVVVVVIIAFVVRWCETVCATHGTTPVAAA